MAMTTQRRRPPRAWIFFWLKSQMSSRDHQALWPYCLTGSLAQPARVLAVNSQSASTRLVRSSGEPDLTGVRRVVAGKLRRSLFQPFLPEEADQRLDLGPEIAALPHQQIEILGEQRDKIEARRFCRGTGRHAAVGLAGPDRGRQIGTRETWRIEPAQLLGPGPGARQ